MSSTATISTMAHMAFVGGGIWTGPDQRPSDPDDARPPGTPTWGAAWKAAVRDNYLSSVVPGTGVHGSFYSYRDVYLDLDPTYRDRFGVADANNHGFPRQRDQQNAFLTDRFAEIIKRWVPTRSRRCIARRPTTPRSTNDACVRGPLWAPIADERGQSLSAKLDVPNLFVTGATLSAEGWLHPPERCARSPIGRRGDPINMKNQDARRC